MSAQSFPCEIFGEIFNFTYIYRAFYGDVECKTVRITVISHSLRLALKPILRKKDFCGLMETPYWYPSERHQQPTFCVDATTGFLAKRAHIKFHTDNASLLLLLRRG